MVPPAQVSDHSVTHRRWNNRSTKWPSQCTDAMHRCPVGPSGAEEHPVWALLCSLNVGVGWTVGLFLKCRFIRCWSKSFGASLYVLNEASDRPLVRALDHPVLKRLSSDPYCCQTLRHRMNRCLYRRFIRRSLLNSLAAEVIRWM
jgi:hypothetical protein